MQGIGKTQVPFLTVAMMMDRSRREIEESDCH
jgi:hypothetical protein